MAEVNLPGFGKTRIINLNGEDVILDPQNLRFTDATLNQFFELVSGFCDYYGQKLADANREVSRAEQLFERLYIEKFKEFREGFGGDGGKSEKTSELYAKAESEVVKAKTEVHETTYKRDSIWNHLKALNAAREDAHNRGHFLRKELDKLNMEVRSLTYDMSHADDPVGGPTETAAAPAIQHRPQPQPRRQPWRGHEDADMEALFQEANKKRGG